MSHILIVDDEPAICWSLKEGLTDLRHQVQVASSMERAEKLLATFTPDLIVLDVRLPGKSGLSALPELRQQQPDTPIIMMTAFGDLPTVVQAINSGAFEYLVKPFEMNEFLSVVERALLTKKQPATALEAVSIDHQLIGRGPAMQAIFKKIALVAPTDFPVLITGETGTGKELVAEAIVRNSLRQNGRFLRVSLASFSPSVIESELFGHVKGAFTGATEDRPGLFELADDGTIFLDEIGDIPPTIQVKLLRVLESRTFTRVGSNDELTTNARLLAATNRDLNAMIVEGTFREDLYHRLKVFSFELPPLREHREDLPPLVEYFIARHTQSSPPLITEEFWSAIEQRTWQGNIRELRNAIDHALVLSRGGPIGAGHLPEPLIVPAGNIQSGDQLETAVAAWVRQQLAESDDESQTDLYRRFLNAAETVLFNEVLSHTQQNRSAAAKLLGLDRATLRTKMGSTP